LERRLAAILVADVVGYSRLMGDDEAGTLERLKFLRRELVQPKITECKGRIVKLMGDGLLAEFPSAVEAVQCAVNIQQEVAEREPDISDDRRIRLRIGINIGDIIVEGEDIYGDGVNVAARLESLAEPGGICVSRTVVNHVKGKVELDFEDLGEQQVKNISDPVRVYLVVLELPAGGSALGGEENLTLPDKPSIAVLPFDNMSSDPDQEYLADGIAEDILTGLSRVRWLFVISRNSSFAYKGQKLDVKRVAKELGVRYVLEGSVRKSSQRVRVTTQLIDAAIDHHVWAERYDRKLDDIFDLQDEITATILGTLEPELGAAEQERARRKPPESLDAWDFYLRGQWHLYRFTAEDCAEALRFFRQAIEIDPNFAASHTGLAYAHHLAAIEAFTDDPAKSLDAAVKAARRAVALDDKDAMGFGVLARILTMRHEHDAALTASQMGNDLNPNIAQVRFGHAFALTFSGRMEEAIDELDEVMRLSPRDRNMWSFMVVRTWALSALGRQEEVVDWARRAAEQPNSVLWPNLMLASALGQLGRRQEARQALDRFHQENPHIDIDDVCERMPFRNPAHVQTIAEGIRLAELSE
jgi:adenylate cyclase